MTNVNGPMAKLFYEQCAGTTTGQMALVPNNPVLFGLVGAHSEKIDNCYSATQTEFAVFLRGVADALDA